MHREVAGKRRAARAATPPVKRVVLAGNPNAGKTTLFNALTGSRLKTGNFHGVTTSPAYRQSGGVLYVDVPGMYSFNGYTMEEASARDEVLRADLIINVVDALTLESALPLTKRLISVNPNVVVYLTKLKALSSRGGRVDCRKLSAHLGVPVCDCPPGELKNLITRGEYATLQPAPSSTRRPALTEAYQGGDGSLKRGEKLLYDKAFALPFFIATLVFTFFITFHPAMPGALLKELLNKLITQRLAGALGGLIKSPVLSSFICEGIIGGAGGVLSFAPQIAILYLTLILLEESGVSSALSFVTDGLFERVGLSGRAAFTLTAGLGCTAAAIATTRGYSEESSRRKTVAVLPLVPCGAKLPVFLTFLSPLFKNPFPAVCALYFAGVALAIAISAIFKGRGEALISEVAPITLPGARNVFKKLSFQVKSFIIKITGPVLAFCTVSWLLSHIGVGGFCAPQQSVLGTVSRLIAYLFYPMGITDWRLAYAALTGFAAKENVAATIALLIPEGLNLSLSSTAAICVFFLVCPACVSAFAASIREVGLKRTLVYNLAQLAAAFLLAYLTNFIFMLV